MPCYLGKIQDLIRKSQHRFCVSLTNKLIQDYSDHSGWKEAKISSRGLILRFPWCTITRVILNFFFSSKETQKFVFWFKYSILDFPKETHAIKKLNNKVIFDNVLRVCNLTLSMSIIEVYKSHTQYEIKTVVRHVTLFYYCLGDNIIIIQPMRW